MSVERWRMFMQRSELPCYCLYLKLALSLPLNFYRKVYCLVYNAGVVCMLYVQGGGSSTQSHLNKLFKSLESFYHPSNYGRWNVSFLLTDLILNGCILCKCILHIVLKASLVAIVSVHHCRSEVHGTKIWTTACHLQILIRVRASCLIVHVHMPKIYNTSSLKTCSRSFIG
jgi:hypothetical protein